MVRALAEAISQAFHPYPLTVRAELAGSLESRVLVSARKFRDLEATGTEEEIDPALPVEVTPRQLQAPEAALLNEKDTGNEME